MSKYIIEVLAHKSEKTCTKIWKAESWRYMLNSEAKLTVELWHLQKYLRQRNLGVV